VEGMLSVNQDIMMQLVSAIEGIEEILSLHVNQVKVSTNDIVHVSMLTILILDPISPPAVQTGCSSNSDCPTYTACENRKCINPCATRNPCAPNAYCKVIQHRPECTCPDGYIGSPTTSCDLRKSFKSFKPL
jgi:hypothetical protein